MWIFTENGFVSAVRHYSESDVIVVRGRDAESMISVSDFADVPVEKTPTNDYPYRVHLSEKTFKEWLIMNVEHMDYTNFKSRVEDMRGDYFSDTLMAVWEIMHRVEDDDARTGR